MTFLSRCLLVLGVLLASACAQQPAPFTPPAERPTPANEAPWPKNHFLGIAYHYVEDRDPDQAVVAVRTERLIEQLAWLRENGYQAVSVDQILTARRGGTPLPPKAIMLSFDDGYSSFYTRVMPILRAYRWPALLAPVGYWIDTPMPATPGSSPTPRATSSRRRPRCAMTRPRAAMKARPSSRRGCGRMSRRSPTRSKP